MTKKIIILVVLAIFLFTSCAVKEDDNLATKAVKHTVMTPVYVGEVLDKGVKLAFIAPFSLASTLFKSDFPDIADAERIYKKFKEFKAFAVAVDSKELYSFGYINSQESQELANQIALETCKEYREHKSVNAQCILYVIGDEKQFELSSLLLDNSTQVNNQTHKIQNNELLKQD
jgi:hypothetical protein